MVSKTSNVIVPFLHKKSPSAQSLAPKDLCCVPPREAFTPIARGLALRPSHTTDDIY